MFQGITLRGANASLVWGYRPAVVLRTWSIRRERPGGPWTLSARVERGDNFTLRRAGEALRFTAPRRGGFWCWPVIPNSIRIAGELLNPSTPIRMHLEITARLGQPEQ